MTFKPSCTSSQFVGSTDEEGSLTKHLNEVPSKFGSCLRRAVCLSAPGYSRSSPILLASLWIPCYSRGCSTRFRSQAHPESQRADRLGHSRLSHGRRLR